MSSSGRPELAVCSASFHNAPHLILNWELTRRLNAGSRRRWQWFVAENTPPAGRNGLSPLDQRFRVLPGVSDRYTPNYQHTEALHKCLEQVASRFLLVLDPDFYVVRRDWIEEILHYMETRGLSFFGVPWHPKYTDKYRYFPCVHCLFVDLERVPLGELDLRPRSSRILREGPDAEDGDAGHGRYDRWQRLLTAVGLGGRLKDYRDTGTRLYYRYAGASDQRWESTQPVVREPWSHPRSWRGRLLERVLPDALCYFPKRRDYCAAVGLREYGLLEGAPPDWEEFVWQGAPFGFHVRRNAGKSRRDVDQELAVLERVVAAHCARQAAPDAGCE